MLQTTARQEQAMSLPLCDVGLIKIRHQTAFQTWKCSTYFFPREDNDSARFEAGATPEEATTNQNA